MKLLVTRTHQTDTVPASYTAHYQLLPTPDEQRLLELYAPPPLLRLIGGRGELDKLLGGAHEHIEEDVNLARQYEQHLIAECQAIPDYIREAQAYQGTEEALDTTASWLVG